MTAKLVLLPLSKGESRKLLKESGNYPQTFEPDQEGIAKLPPAEQEKAEQAYKRPRKTITLILPKESNIIELDSDEDDDEIPVRDENNEVICLICKKSHLPPFLPYIIAPSILFDF